MRVAPISKAQMLAVVPRKITRPQLLSYWGMNSKERLQRILESLLVSYGGAWMAWFVSFMAGSLVSAVLGTALIFNWMYTPWLNARRRNARVYPSSGKLETVYYAVFLGLLLRLSFPPLLRLSSPPLLLLFSLPLLQPLLQPLLLHLLQLSMLPLPLLSSPHLPLLSSPPLQ